MMSFAAVLELATVVAYTVVIIGGKQKRENGWKVLAFLLGVVGLLQCASMGIVVCSHNFPFTKDVVLRGCEKESWLM